MRKLYLVVASCVALVAFTGFSASALAEPIHDPGCDEWGNKVGLFDFEIDSPQNHEAGKVSNLTASAYACGSDIDTFGRGAETLYNHFDIIVPKGVKVADSDSVPVGSYVGSATVNILYHVFGPQFDEDVPIVMRTYDKAKCEQERREEIDGETPEGTIVGCVQGRNALGGNWNWTVRNDDTGRLSYTIGPMHDILGLGIDPGLTHIDVNWCARFGPTDEAACGSGRDQWIQKNGKPSETKSCKKNGKFTISGYMRNGTYSTGDPGFIVWTSDLPVVCGSNRVEMESAVRIDHP